MQATLCEGVNAAGLKPGIRGAIAASADDATLAAELELIAILEGPAFCTSSRSRAFLRFVVEEALAGRADMLKERTIGAAVLGKPSDYDTGADSAVRVRANEVRKRLSVHYQKAAPKAGIRIELPVGSYAPRLTPVPALSGVPSPVKRPRPPRMLLWQLASPTLVGVFLALTAIRAGVESSDAFSRFWNQALAGRTEIAVEVDPDAGAAISPAMADAAMPLERLASALQVPVHIVAADDRQRPGVCVIRLSLTGRPDGAPDFSLGRAAVFRGPRGGPAIWVWAEDAGALRSAAQILTSRAGFPEMP